MPRPPELVTVGLLARELRRPKEDICGAMDRHGIQPAAIAGNVRVFHPDVLRTLRRIFNTEDATRSAKEGPGND